MRRVWSVSVVVLLAACGGDGRELRDPTVGLPAVTTTTTAPVITTPVVELTLPVEPIDLPSPSEPSTIEIERLDSPANATAEMTGRGANGSEPVTVDGDPADVLSFEVSDEGVFVVQVWIEDEGAHTVCLADACGRVYTLAPDAASPEEIAAMIEEALPLAREYVDWPSVFPDWTIAVGGALAGTGGTTDVDTKTITVYRNRGRTVDDFVRTILHEFGHVVDDERLDDDGRARYLDVRGVDPTVAWSDAADHRLDAWGQQPSEDFAEVMVMIWTEGRWTPRTTVAADPTLADLATILGLLDPALV